MPALHHTKLTATGIIAYVTTVFWVSRGTPLNISTFHLGCPSELKHGRLLKNGAQQVHKDVCKLQSAAILACAHTHSPLKSANFTRRGE